MSHIAIITAKGSNQSIPNKNLIKVDDHSFLARQIMAAKESTKIQDVFVSTEDNLIKEEAQKYDAKIIQRPDYLAQPDSNHGDTILHAYIYIQQMYNIIETVTILLGNTIAVRGIDIDKNISLLAESPEATSCMTVWHAQDDHPFRAMQINEDGYLESYLKNSIPHTNRQSYPPIYYYDQGPWTVKSSVLQKAINNLRTGPACWWWMGDKCIPVIRNWVTGRDIHTELDVAFSRFFIKNNLWDI